MMWMALLRKYWLPLLLAVAAAVAMVAAYNMGRDAGKAAIQKAWDKDIEQRTSAQRAEKDRLERHYADQIQQAIAARDAQIKRVQADADGARAAAGSLRQQLAASRGRVAQVAPAAVVDYTDAVADVLGECAARYTEVARAADGHAADADALMRAWPGR